uniref:migration and invasion enhancer 1 isoform X1 n=1 Tax=Callithrix jacchus TaxID=9483 RepID=UPI0008403FDE|nr:migration and invasion enhancer 1 isoform X1 [Callithrix jacchus]
MPGFYFRSTLQPGSRCQGRVQVPGRGGEDNQRDSTESEDQESRPPGREREGLGAASEPCGFEATYLELASAVKEQYPGIEIESRLGGTGAFEIEINGQLVFSKLENGGFPYEKDVSIYSVGRTSGSPTPTVHPAILHLYLLAH